MLMKHRASQRTEFINTEIPYGPAHKVKGLDAGGSAALPAELNGGKYLKWNKNWKIQSLRAKTLEQEKEGEEYQMKIGGEKTKDGVLTRRESTPPPP